MDSSAISSLFNQLAFINAILGGFAFAFVGALLSANEHNRIANWTAGSAIAASSCFTISAVLATAAAMYIFQQQKELFTQMPDPIASVYNPTILLFFLGLLFFAVSIGLSGWLFSKKVGITSTVAAFALFITSITLLILF
jgi:hypothetical protein